MPNEKHNASTTKVQVLLPATQPLGSVLVQPHPGWTFKVTTAKLATPVKTDDGQVSEAVSTITWTAVSPATAIKPGQFEEFVVAVGPLPKADSMQFKTLQTYSNGDVVRWIEDGTAPEHPVPTLKLTPAVAEDASASAPTTGSASASKSPSTKVSDSSAASQSSVNIALGLAGTALIVGLIAGGLALRRRNPAASPHES